MVLGYYLVPKRALKGALAISAGKSFRVVGRQAELDLVENSDAALLKYEML